MKYTSAPRPASKVARLIGFDVDNDGCKTITDIIEISRECTRADWKELYSYTRKQADKYELDVDIDSWPKQDK